MRKLFVSLLFLVFISSFGQDKITTSAWQEDLRFLQNTVNEKYPFLFKKIGKSDFNAAVDTFYDEIPNLESHEIVVGFSRMIALFKYGHTRMSYSDAPISFHSIPVEFYRFKDGLRIKSAYKDYGDIIGAKVIAIEGMPIENVMKAVYPTVPVENKMFFDAYGLDHMTIPQVLHAQGVTSRLKSDIILTLEKDGREFEKVLQAKENLWPPMKYGEIQSESDWVN